MPALANPVSVAFGADHLYILTTEYVESHRIDNNGVSPIADGHAALVIGDGSAAQVGTLHGELVISEKSNAIETVNLDRFGRITGRTKLAENIPANVNAPFGLATRGDNAYVTPFPFPLIASPCSPLVQPKLVAGVARFIKYHAPGLSCFSRI